MNRHLPLTGIDIGSGELAERLGIQEPTLYRWGRLLGFEHGRRVGAYWWRWSPEQQWALCLVAELRHSMQLNIAIECADLIVSLGHRTGWVAINPADFRVAWVELSTDLGDLMPGRGAFVGTTIIVCLDVIAERYGHEALRDVPTGSYL